MSLVLLVLQLFGRLWSDALGRLRTIALGTVAAAAGYLLLPLSPSWTWVMLALCLETIPGALVAPSFAPFVAEQSTEESRGRVCGLAYSSLLSKGVPEKSRGLASATLQSTISLVQLPAPWMGAQVWEHWSPRAPFAISAAANAVSLLPAGFKLKRVGGGKT